MWAVLKTPIFLQKFITNTISRPWVDFLETAILSVWSTSIKQNFQISMAFATMNSSTTFKL